jgi:hypothetical protein
MFRKLFLIGCLIVVCIGLAVPFRSQETKKATPADGHTIHVTAPHTVNGHVMGPYHHYCKGVTPEIFECLIYDSDEPNALLKQVEYFVAKSVSRPNVPLKTWNRYYHDHAIEIASGRVKVLDVSDEEAKKIAETASQTDGIIFHLWWPDDAKAPNGTVIHAQAVGHKPRKQ